MLFPDMSFHEARYVVVSPWRPPTAVYPDRHQVAHFRDEHFPPTATGREQVFKINLEGAFFSPGALMEMILPVAQAIKSGAYGPTVLVVVTSDDGTSEFLEALAERHNLSLFISSSPTEPLSEARPIGALTTTEIETFALMRRAGGVVTSSQVAELAGIESNAAGNRLNGLLRKGYIHRVSRPRRDGDTFVDLLTAADQCSGAPQNSSEVSSAGEEFDVPQDVRQGVLLLAAIHGAQPGEILVRAWREFLERHRDLLTMESEEVGRMLREGDTAGLVDYANRFVRERAKEAAARLKRLQGE